MALAPFLARLATATWALPSSSISRLSALTKDCALRVSGEEPKAACTPKDGLVPGRGTVCFGRILASRMPTGSTDILEDEPQ